MYSYEEDNSYIDEEKRSKVPFFILFIIIVVIIFVVVLSCGMKDKNNNSNLGYLRVSNATITPEFDKNKYNYSVITTSDKINISCGSESSKSKIEGCNKDINIDTNIFKHVIKVTAEDGSFKKYTLNITKDTKFEKLAVTIESSIKSNEKTKEEVILNTKLNLELDSLKYEWYKDAIKIENATDSSFIAKESGTYYVKVINGSDTVLSNEFIVNIVKSEETPKKESTTPVKTILKIDSITGNSSSWVGKVTLKVNATSSNGIIGYSFDGGKTYQKSNTKKFTKNQTVNIFVKDKLGNTVSKKEIISKVDSSIPKVTISYSDRTAKSINLIASINPSNVPSGYKYKWYKDGKVIENAKSLTYKATESGKYKFEVKTGSGIVASTSYEFKIVNITCPNLLVTDSTGRAVKHNTWINDYIFVKITPSIDTFSYKVYLNEDGHYDSISKNFNYFDTYNKEVKVKIVNGGIRIVKLVVSDKEGNEKICYSRNYYLK